MLGPGRRSERTAGRVAAYAAGTATSTTPLTNDFVALGVKNLGDDFGTFTVYDGGKLSTHLCRDVQVGDVLEIEGRAARGSNEQNFRICGCCA